MRLAILFIGCFFTQLCYGQRFSGILNLNAGIPTGEFKEVSSNTGLGLRLNFLYRPSDIAPVYIGLEAGYMTRATKSHRYGGDIDGYYHEFKVSASSNVVSLFFNVRFQSPGNAMVKPFIDGMFGFNDFFAAIYINSTDDYGYYYHNTSKAKWTLAYGGSAGLDIRLGKYSRTFLEIKASYLLGQNNKYLIDPKIDDNGNVSFKEKSSETDMLIPQIGIKFDF